MYGENQVKGKEGMVEFQQGGYVLKEDKTFHCVKTVHIWSFSGPYFLAFGLNMEI